MPSKGGTMGPYIRCVFCLTGHENSVISRIREKGLGLALSPRKRKPMKIDGQWIDREEALMPGYVFVYTDEETDLAALRRTEGVARVLTYGAEDDTGYLMGADYAFALSMLEKQGVVDKLEAFREGEFIRISDGALRDLQGKVLGMNRRRHTVNVEVTFLGEKRSLWLGYEVVEAILKESAGQ